MILVAIYHLLVATVMCLYRVVVGPTACDRLVAADCAGLMLAVLLVLLGFQLGSPVFLDVAMVYGLLLFLDMLVIAKYLERGEIGG